MQTHRAIAMKFHNFASLTLFAALFWVVPAKAENLQHVQQLMSTRECQSCDLSRAGLVFSNLSAVDLSQANLSLANLNQANLSGSNLANTDLSGAVLVRANLSGADLSGANLAGADLREAYLYGANLEGANLDGAILQGAIGLPEELIGAQQFYSWGIAEFQRGNFSGAIDYYNQALTKEPDFSAVYLARSLARYRLGDEEGAIADANRAEQLFAAEGNENGRLASVQVAEGIVEAQEALEEANGRGGGGGGFIRFIGGLASMLLRFGL
ncbi:pentapeptide repeat-containing protein [Leptolyngbya sp. FACHB-541]|uniref:pentapeptide repeat-containing protein n=1 Tax=Leptolyngbya sp. FACHB-541 TaxID=2692810 RepID=UPI0018F05AF4